MRKLGKGQSVIFCVPEEIKIKILKCPSKLDKSSILPEDVLKSAISETSADMRRSMPLWATQGRRFEKQQCLWEKFRASGNAKMPKALAEEFLEEEAQTLEARYRPSKSTGIHNANKTWTAHNQNLSRIAERCRDFGSMDTASASLHEEQERELAPEIEQERQLEKPSPAEAEVHHLHPDLKTLAATGKLKQGSTAFLSAFESLKSSSASSHFDLSQFPTDILVTADFARTVKVTGSAYISDNYQQPVQWVLTAAPPRPQRRIEKLIVISSFEAQQLLPIIQANQAATLHIYAPRINSCYPSLDGLDLFPIGKSFNPSRIPRRLTLQLNLFAGQPYLNSFAEYKELCTFLSLASEPSTGKDARAAAADGFIAPKPGDGGFRESPVMFLKTLFTKIRRNCGSIDGTHMGRILNGEILVESDFGER